MQLTQAGEMLLGYARELVGLADRAERQMQGLRGMALSRVEIACAPSTGERLLPGLLAAFHELSPGLQFSIQVGPGERLMGWLMEGAVQAVFVDEHPRRRTVDVIELGHEPIICIAARGHQTLLSGPISPSDLGETTLILPARGSALRRTVEEYLRRRGVLNAASITLETDSVHAAAQAVADGLGVAFVPQRIPRNRDVGVVSLVDWQITQPWFLVRQRSGDGTRAINDLWEFALSANGRKLINRLGLR
ncbi:MAG: LysR family transcriptional regulator [Herpetosiphon sp.]